RKSLQQPRQDLGMVGYPLKHSVTEQEIGFSSRHPDRQIALDEGATWQPLASLTEHIWRGIDPDHLRVGEPFDQQFGRVARSAAEIDYALRIIERDMRQEISRRASALVLELEILPGTPVVGRSAEI